MTTAETAYAAYLPPTTGWLYCLACLSRGATPSDARMAVAEYQRANAPPPAQAGAAADTCSFPFLMGAYSLPRRAATPHTEVRSCMFYTGGGVRAATPRRTHTHAHTCPPLLRTRAHALRRLSHLPRDGCFRAPSPDFSWSQFYRCDAGSIRSLTPFSYGSAAERTIRVYSAFGRDGLAPRRFVILRFGCTLAGRC